MRRRTLEVSINQAGLHVEIDLVFREQDLSRIIAYIPILQPCPWRAQRSLGHVLRKWKLRLTFSSGYWDGHMMLR